MIEVMLLLLLALSAALAHAQPADCTVETVLGGSPRAAGDGGPAVDAELFFPGVARLGADGSLYIVDTNHNRIRRVRPDGVMEGFAGTGVPENFGDGGPAIEAGLRNPHALAFGPDGSVYFLDAAPHPGVFEALVVRRVNPEGVISTVAGGLPVHDGDDGGTAKDAALGRFSLLSHLAVGPDGSLYVTGGHRVRRILPSGRIETVAGVSDPNEQRGSSQGDGGPAAEAALDRPGSIVAGPDGTVLFVDAINFRVRRIHNNLIAAYMGGPGGSPDDGTLRQSARWAGQSLGMDGEGRIYWRDGRAIKRISLEDRVETIWEADAGLQIFRFSVSADGRLFATFRNHIAELVEGGETVRWAGREEPPLLGEGEDSGGASLLPNGISLGPSGELYVSSFLLFRTRVFTSGGLRRFAGTGIRGRNRDPGPAGEAEFFSIVDVAAGPDGSVYVAESHLVRRVDPQGIVSIYAGDGNFRCDEGVAPGLFDCGDGGPALEAQIPSIADIEVDSSGILYILNQDQRNVRAEPWVRKVTPDGTIDSLARNPQQRAWAIGLDGDDLLVVSGAARSMLLLFDAAGQASAVELPLRQDGIGSAAGDGSGNLYLTVFGGVLRLGPDGVLDTIVPTWPGDAPAGDGGLAPQGRARSPWRLQVDSAGDLYFIDGRRRVRRVAGPSACPSQIRPLVSRSLFTPNFGRSAPGGIGSLFGVGLGPEQGVGASLDADGRVTTQLAGVRVWIDGTPAPLLFVSARQINAIVPFATAVSGSLHGVGDRKRFANERVSRIQVEVDGIFSEPKSLTLAAAAPALFTVDGRQAAALNQNGSLNTQSNPAAPGSVIVLFGTGAGLTDPPGADGAIATPPFARPVGEASAEVDEEPAALLYLGDAPGLVAGVFQANVRIPDSLRASGSLRVDIRVGESGDELRAPRTGSIWVGRPAASAAR